MAIQSDDPLPPAQREVQRLLGRCLLRLQQYERQIKAIIASIEISGPADALETARAERAAETGRKTLGALVGEFVASFVLSDETGASIADRTDAAEVAGFVRVRFRVTMPDADLLQMADELRELVSLRNGLVHHFIDQHELSSVDGCRSARDALGDAYDFIDHSLTRLREWAEDMEQCRLLAAECVRSPEFHDLVVDGIGPDGAVDWPDAGIVRALQEAARALAIDGWVPVAAAASWMAERYPEQTPERYGCRTLRQVIHESRCFELRCIERDKRRERLFRIKHVAIEPGR